MKKQIVKDLRNAERKRKRLRELARQLTDEGLLSVMLMGRDIKKEATAAGTPEEAESNTDAGAPVHSPSAGTGRRQSRTAAQPIACLSPACLDAALAAILATA